MPFCVRVRVRRFAARRGPSRRFDPRTCGVALIYAAWPLACLPDPLERLLGADGIPPALIASHCARCIRTHRIRTHTYTHTYTHAHTYTYTYTYAHAHTHAPIHAHTYAHVHAYARTHIHALRAPTQVYGCDGTSITYARLHRYTSVMVQVFFVYTHTNTTHIRMNIHILHTRKNSVFLA